MVDVLGCGPFDAVDGPPPIPPDYGLLPAADAAVAGVRIVPSAPDGIPRWANGAETRGWPASRGAIHNPLATGSSAVKESGSTTQNGQFRPFTAYLPDQCSTFRIADENEFRQRILTAFYAVESSIVAREFLSGSEVSSNPHLADGTGDFPNANTAVTPPSALALLEAAIAASGRSGVIHVSPQMLTTLGGTGHIILNERLGVHRTIAGTLVVADAGYADGDTPSGHTPATATQEWIFASGAIDLRRTQPIVLPEDLWMAVDRSTNDLEYIVERHYLISWDTTIHASVLADRCGTGCA